MAFTVVQSRATGGSSASQPLAFSSTPTVGNFLVCVAATFSASSTCSDNASNTWTKISQVGTTAAGAVQYLFIAANCHGSATTVTVGTTGTIDGFVIAEISGVSTTATSANAVGTFFDSGSGTTSWTTSTSTGSALSGDFAVAGTGDGNVTAATTPTTSTTNWALLLHNSTTISETAFRNLAGVSAGTVSVALASSAAAWPTVLAAFSAAGGATDPFPAAYNLPAHLLNNACYRM